MAQAEIHSGICGCVTQVTAELADPDMVRLSLESTCGKVQRMAQELAALPLLAAFAPILRNPVHQAADRQQFHASCPVPAGILKAVEVAGGLALPKDAEIFVRR